MEKIDVTLEHFLGYKTCHCKENITLYSYYDDKLSFVKGREYKVEVFASFYNVYLVNDFYHYVSLNEDEFDKYFELVM